MSFIEWYARAHRSKTIIFRGFDFLGERKHHDNNDVGINRYYEKHTASNKDSSSELLEVRNVFSNSKYRASIYL